MLADWQGESRRRPQVTRFRLDDMFGLRVKCWHGAVAELVYPHRDVVLSWEYPASLNPCRWVPACPNYAWLMRVQKARIEWESG